MKKIAVIVSAIAILAMPTTTSARASMSVTDTTFPGDAYITYVEPSQYNGGLWARADCYASGQQVYSQYEKLDGIDDKFEIDVTPSWSGGSAECHAQMLVLNGYRRDKVVAETTFSVTP